MSERFSDDLRRQLDPVWQALHRHPFVRSLGDGSLEPATFLVWLRQDYLLLGEHARLLALGGARGDWEMSRWLISRAQAVFQQEALLHEACAVERGLTPEELAAGFPLPTTHAYADHLLRTAALGTIPELVAALLPRTWGRYEIATQLASEFADGPYTRWVEAFSSPASGTVVRQSRELLDRLAAAAAPTALAGAADAFATSSRYEWMFLEMCVQNQVWPI